MSTTKSPRDLASSYLVRLGQAGDIGEQWGPSEAAKISLHGRGRQSTAELLSDETMNSVALQDDSLKLATS